ncbi:MAG TPA: D-alanyl-D-alanine carboxypeptidase/D-alanyl-D-alanine-endopeptidase [Chitinophagaceae bacterium]
MKANILMIGLLFASFFSLAQTVQQRLNNAVQILLKDEQMKHAILSLYVVETNSGKLVYKLNDQIGLAPASTQKLFTSIAAFELLGTGYRFKTEIGYDGEIKNSLLDGNFYITGYGDPTFGSFRYAGTKTAEIKKKITDAINAAGIKTIRGNIILDNSKFSYQPLPGGWIWDDIGNYYGAGTWALNWNENQYDLVLKPGKNEGDAVNILDTSMNLHSASFINLLKTGKQGGGDNGYIYLPPYSANAFVTGTEPAGESAVTISGALPDPSFQIKDLLQNVFKENDIDFKGSVITLNEYTSRSSKNPPHAEKLMGTIYSPVFDSVNYWFLQRSVNLYGEALTKTIAYEKTGFGSTEKGVEIIKDFWEQHGIEKSAINIIDGSGLSPQNRVTTNALVKILQYAKTRLWNSSFYDALPTYNNMKMKSGTISGAKSFAGYHTSKNGTTYTFAIVINNFNETKGNIVPKMYKVLDELK